MVLLWLHTSLLPEGIYFAPVTKQEPDGDEPVLHYVQIEIDVTYNYHKTSQCLCPAFA